MASQTPPPYFPQASLAPSDPNRYRKFKAIVAAIAVALILLLIGIGVGIFYFARAVF